VVDHNHQAFVMKADGAGCGDCSLCCTLMGVEMEPVKPAFIRCRHCGPLGCAIYADRPDVCEGFMCAWLASQKLGGLQLPAWMRPDRVGVVIDINSAGAIIAHCESREAWQREPMRSWLIGYAARTMVFLEMASGAEALDPDGTTHRLVKVGVDPVTNNRLYVREAELAAYQALQASVGKP
jgi:hypothetical protein